MGFSCTIMIKGRDLTKYEGGEISCKLFGLGPNGSEQTSAPYRLEDFRDIPEFVFIRKHDSILIT